ncbi:hypothetical protein R1flu_014146 [Riccia fluitans]|uniref:Uncharacterized protein n=1 Tax=Riccia fluitans TaxID=41844 RepID=A0ABD1YFM3_9MARC
MISKLLGGNSFVLLFLIVRNSMSIVDVRDHRLRGRAHEARERYSERTTQTVTRVNEVYYILAVTVAFVGLLCSTTGISFFSSRQQEKPPTQDETVPGPEMTSTYSPLQLILRQDQWKDAVISTYDENHQLEMQQRATMEESSLIIGETIVPYESREELSHYVGNQMEASKMISKEQAEAILDMIRLKSSDLIFLRIQTGMFGELKNSMILALCTHKGEKTHFMLLALQVEAHLGWKIIPSGKRSSWNKAMKASLERKMRSEIQTFLGSGYSKEVDDSSGSA